MKLIKLEILNLASLDNPKSETINFEEGVLKDCTIFSIVKDENHRISRHTKKVATLVTQFFKQH